VAPRPSPGQTWEAMSRRRWTWALAVLLALPMLSLAVLALCWGAKADDWWACPSEPTLLPPLTVEVGQLFPLTPQNVEGTLTL
jgi:hypothetical protein